MSSYEVGVIGAGIYGASVAHHLGRAGVRTVLIERETPASGPTGASSAVCRSGYTNPFLARIAHESIESFGHFDDLTGGGDAGFVRTGMLYLHRAEDSGAPLDALVAHLRTLGIDVSEVTGDRLADEHPWLVIGEGERAVWEAGAGHADPVGTTRALVQDAQRHGVELLQRTAVAQIAERPQGGAVLRTADGDRIEVERLLLAAGPWTSPLLAQVGVSLPLIVERHSVATFSWGDVPQIPYVLGDVRGGYYLKPEGPQQYGLGSLLAEEQVDPDDYQQDVGGEEAMAIAESAIARVPTLEATEPAGGWGSLYDVSPDWQPVIGAVGDGIFVVAGTSGHGFKLAPALGREIAGLVTGRGHEPALEQFTPERFATGATLEAGFGDARILG